MYLTPGAPDASRARRGGVRLILQARRGRSTPVAERGVLQHPRDDHPRAPQEPDLPGVEGTHRVEPRAPVLPGIPAAEVVRNTDGTALP